MKLRTYKPSERNIERFLIESNKIEREYSLQALESSLSAWKFLISQPELTLTNIKYAHALLMRFIYPDIAGVLRKVNVMVGVHTCPDWKGIVELMLEWIIYFKDAKTPKDILQAHIAFEKIHPFQDGNGRIGRIIMGWQRIKNNLPIAIIHEGDEQWEYYKLFQ
jgi:Fic family protein